MGGHLLPDGGGPRPGALAREGGRDDVAEREVHDLEEEVVDEEVVLDLVGRELRVVRLDLRVLGRQLRRLHLHGAFIGQHLLLLVGLHQLVELDSPFHLTVLPRAGHNFAVLAAPSCLAIA